MRLTFTTFFHIKNLRMKVDESHIFIDFFLAKRRARLLGTSVLQFAPEFTKPVPREKLINQIKSRKYVFCIVKKVFYSLFQPNKKASSFKKAAAIFGVCLYYHPSQLTMTRLSYPSHCSISEHIVTTQLNSHLTEKALVRIRWSLQHFSSTHMQIISVTNYICLRVFKNINQI